MKIKSIDLFGKPLFKLLTLDSSIQMAESLPENEACFLYVLKGHCVNYSEIEIVKASSNQAMLAKCGNNAIRLIVNEDTNEYNALIINFHKEVLEKIYGQSVPSFFKKKKLPLQANIVNVNSTVLIKQYVDGIIEYFNNQNAISEDILILKLQEIILLLLQTNDSPKVLEIMGNLFTKKTFAFKEIIEAHICSSITIEEFAKLTNHSLSSFNREFRKVYNDTPSNYIIGKRVDKVAELLLVSDQTISNIAYECEFKSIAHLSRVFKTKFGTTPSKYRLKFSDKQ